MAGGIWVPWRAGNTARQQAAIKNKKTRGTGRPDANTTKAAIRKKRRALFQQRKKGQITTKQYHQALRRLR
jgi:hypothetical protein